MPEPEAQAPQAKRPHDLARTAAKFIASWLVVYVTATDQSGRFARADMAIRDAIYKILSGFPAAEQQTERLYQDCKEILSTAFGLTLFFGTGLAVLGAATRMIARARKRAGQPDFLDRIRAWTAAHPKGTKWLLAVPSIAWLLLLVWPGPWELQHIGEYLTDVSRATVPDLLTAGGIYALAKKGTGELLAPTEGGSATQTRVEIGADEIAFDAVAVTRQTLAMVTLFTAITLAVPAFIWTRPILDLFRETSIFYLVGAYITFAATGAYAFRKASRISVGVDGVHIRGTSRARFFAYRDLDSARANGSDLELVRRGKVILRLQLHGEDASRRDAILARITEHIARVRDGRGAAAAQIVASASKDELARAASGAGDYRIATLTREQLWALVEGPEIEATARRAAAEALVQSNDGADRARLRVAAEHCAEPQVRIALEEIAEEHDAAAPPAATRAQGA